MSVPPAGAKVGPVQLGDVAPDFELPALIAGVKESGFVERVQSRGIPWRGAMQELIDRLPASLDRRDDLAYSAVKRLLDETLGPGAWETERRPRASGSGTTVWIVARQPSPALETEIPF